MNTVRPRRHPPRAAAWLLVLTATGLALAAVGPQSVAAHALLKASTPAAGSTLGSAPSSIVLTFTESPDPRLSSVHLLNSTGGSVDTGAVEVVADPPNSLRVSVGTLNDGVYTVSWRTVSSVDGHVAGGTFSFGVGVAPPTGPPGADAGGTSASGSPPAVIARLLLYLGLVVLLGAAFVAVAVARRTLPQLLVMAAVGWTVAALGTVAVIAVQWIEADAPIEAILGTSIGTAALVRAATLALVGLAIAALAVVPPLAGRRGWLLLGVAAALAWAADVALGHAAAGDDWPLQIGAQWLHGLGAGLWMGGLAGLLVILPSTPAGERALAARRYSFWAAVSLVLVGLTGFVRGLAEIGTLDALVATDFGRVVLGKTAIFVGLGALGGFNRFITLRNAARVLGGLRRVGGAELVLAVIVFALSALLVNLTPPTSVQGPSTPAPQPIVATGHDFGTSVKARLVATPGAAGPNAFDLVLSDYDSGEPVDATSASLRFRLASQSGVAPSTLVLRSSGPGHFSGSGPDLSIDGIWEVTATVTRQGTAVEVPLVAATVVPAEPVQTLVSEGLPTLYTVQLGAAGSAQVYLDPGGPGQNDLHVTFFDPAGTELPTRSATMAASPAGGGGSILAERMLEPGHFVASIDAVAGDLTVDAISPLPDASAGNLHLHVTIEVSP